MIPSSSPSHNLEASATPPTAKEAGPSVVDFIRKPTAILPNSDKEVKNLTDQSLNFNVKFNAAERLSELEALIGIDPVAKHDDEGIFKLPENKMKNMEPEVVDVSEKKIQPNPHKPMDVTEQPAPQLAPKQLPKTPQSQAEKVEAKYIDEKEVQPPPLQSAGKQPPKHQAEKALPQLITLPPLDNREIVGKNICDQLDDVVQNANIEIDKEKNQSEKKTSSSNTSEKEISPSKWESAKQTLKNIWKTQEVKAIVFGAAAVLSLVTVGASIAALPFTFGTSAPLVAISSVAFVLFAKMAYDAASKAWGKESKLEESKGTAADASPVASKPPDFKKAYNNLVKESKSADKNYRPLFEKFISNPNVINLLNDPSINHRSRSMFKLDNIIILNDEITAQQKKIEKNESKLAALGDKPAEGQDSIEFTQKKAELDMDIAELKEELTKLNNRFNGQFSTYITEFDSADKLLH